MTGLLKRKKNNHHLERDIKQNMQYPKLALSEHRGGDG